MVQAEKKAVGTTFLKPQTVKDGLTRVKIVDEFIYVDTEFEGKDTGKKLQGHVVSAKNPGEQITWTLNATTTNWMIDKHGPDTEKWIGLEIDLAVKQAGSASPGVYPKECSLEKVIA